MATVSKASHWPLTILGGLSSIFNMIAPLVLVRHFSQSDIGEYKVYFLYLGIGPMLMGASAITNGLARFSNLDHRGLSYLKTSFHSLSIISFVFCLLAFIGFSFSTHQNLSTFELFLLMQAIFWQAVGLFLDEALVVKGFVWRGGIVSSGFDFLRNISVLAIAFKVGKMVPIFEAHLLISMTKVIATVYMTRNYLKLFSGNWRTWVSKKDLSDLGLYWWPLFFTHVLTIVTNTTDQLILSSMLTPERFSVYAMGILVVPPLLIFEQSVCRILIPNLSIHFENGDLKAASLGIRKAMTELAWLLIPATVGLFFFAKEIITLLYTEKFIESAGILQIFAVGYIMMSIPFDAVLRARGRSRMLLSNLIVSTVVALILMGICLPLFQEKGAIAASMLTQLFLRIFSFARGAKDASLKISELIPYRSYLIFSVLAVGIIGTAKFFSQTQYQAYVFAGLAGGLYLLVTFKKRLTFERTL